MHQESATAQAVLEGVELPASKSALLAYAREHEAEERILGVLGWIEDREYDRLDDVGEAIAAVQPSLARAAPDRPAAESGRPPGGDAYAHARAEPGAIRGEPDVLEYEEQLVREP